MVRCWGLPLIELIRNALLLLGVDPYWQGTFVGRLHHSGRRARASTTSAGGAITLALVRIPTPHPRSSLAPRLLLVLLAVLVSACAGGSDNEADPSYVIAVVPKAMNNPFFDQARDGCKAAEAELENVRCEYIGPGEHTEAEQVQIVQDLITRRVDALAIAPSNAPAMASVLARAKEAGIPVVTWGLRPACRRP